MKHLSFFHNGNEISIHNSLLGVESIRYNGEKMTSKFSILGATHVFSVHEDDRLVDYRVEVGMNLMGVTFSLWRNGKALMLSGSNNNRRQLASSTSSDLV